MYDSTSPDGKSGEVKSQHGLHALFDESEG